MPRQGKNIYQRKDGRWEGKKLDSKYRYGFVFGKTYREVAEKLDILKRTGQYAADVSRTKFKDVATEWLSVQQPE